MQNATVKAAKRLKSSAKASNSPASAKSSLTRLSDEKEASGNNKVAAIALTGGSISPSRASACDFDLMDELAKSKAVAKGVPITSAITKQKTQASSNGVHWLPAHASPGASSLSQTEVHRGSGTKPSQAVPILKFAPHPLMVTTKTSQLGAPAESDGEDSYLRLPPAQLDRVARRWKARRKARRTRDAK